MRGSLAAGNEDINAIIGRAAVPGVERVTRPARTPASRVIPP